MRKYHPPHKYPLGSKLTFTAGLHFVRYVCRLSLVFAIFLQSAPAFAASDSVQDFAGAADVQSATTGNDYYAANLFATAPAGTITNTVSVGSTTTDPNAVNNTAVQTTTVNSVADLAITKTDGIGSLVPGTTITYTIVVNNSGPSSVSDAVIKDTLPAAIASATWSCSASGGSSCGTASGSGDINTTVDLAVGGVATFTVVALTEWTAVGSLVNTATITPPVDTTDPDPSDNSSTDTDTLLTGVLTGTVFLDVNNDNTQDGSEGLDNITLMITTSVGTTFTVTTDSNGYFTATVPAGVTIVDVVNADLPTGAVQIAGTDPTTVTVPAGGSASDLNGYELQGDVYGHIFQDTDGNGFQNGGEPNLPNIDVVITDSFGVTQTVTTDANGNYTAIVPVSDLETLTDTVTVDVVESTLPAGSVQTAGTDPDTVTVQSGVSTDAGDDGYQPQGLVQGVVYVDENGDGVYTPGTDTPLDNVTIVITDSNGVTYTVITNAGGAYSLTVPSGNTTVDVDGNDPDLPSGVVLTGGSTDPTTVIVPGGGTATDDTGYVQYSSIGDRLWLDLNGDGIQDANEPGLANVVVELTRPNRSVITTTTGPAGYYNFSGLVPGIYTVTVDTTTLPASVTQTGDRDATFDDETVVTITSNSGISDADFGYQGDSAIGDLVWRDRNGDGVKTGDELGLSGVVITLTLSNGWEITTTTSGAGAYEFAGLIPGTYTVTVDSTTLPVGSVQTADRDSTFDHETVVNLAVSTVVIDADFGYQRQGEVIGHIFQDTNGDGDQDSGEPDLNNISVIITDSMGVTQTVTTDASGNYTATVVIDSSTAPTDTITVDVDETTLAGGGWVQTAGTDPEAITVTAGTTTNAGNDGYQQLGVVEGTVYEDVNQNGSYEVGTDIALDNIAVLITDSNGMTYTVLTDSSGYFSQTVPIGSTTVDVNDADIAAEPGELMLEKGATDPITVIVPDVGVATTDFPYVEPLVIDKDVVTPAVIAGMQVTYTVVVRNIGAYTVTTVTVSDTLPVSFTYASSSLAAAGANRTSTVNPTLGATTPTWGAWSIYPGGAVTITVVANIASSVVPGTYDNTAYAISDQTTQVNDDGAVAEDDNTPTDDDPEDDEDTTVSSQADLGVVKSDTPDPVAAGGTLTYTIVVTNYGPSDAQNVVITDTLPADVSFVSAAGCSLTGSNVVCSLGSIANGTAKRITIVVTVDQDLLVAAANTGPALVQAPASEQAQATFAEPVAATEQTAATALLQLPAAATDEVLAAATSHRAVTAQAAADVLALAQINTANSPSTGHQASAALNPAGEIFQSHRERAGPDRLT